MRILTGSAITLLCIPAVIAQAPAAAPTIGQRLAAERPEIIKMMDAFDYAGAQARAEALLPATKPVFDKSSVNALHFSTRNFVDICQVYFLAFQCADANGQWEKGLEYLNKALETAQENVNEGKAGLTEQRDYYTKKAAAFKALIDRNADAIQALHAKAKLEDYEEGNMATVKAWEKEMAEGDKWAKFFQYDIDLAARTVDDFTRFVGIQDKKIKDQIADIDAYKPHPGNKIKWVDAVISNKAYLEAYTEKADKVALLHRLMVLDPENTKVPDKLDVILGKAPVERATPKKHK